MDQFQKPSSMQQESHSAAQEQEEVIDCWRYGQVTSASLNVRKQPSLSAPRWNNVWPINRIALIKPAVEGWYETLYRGEQAFVSAKFVRPLSYPMTDRIVDRMFFMAIPEVGRDQSIYFNGYNGKWCHRFADWLPMHAGTPKERIPNTSNCGAGIVWFCVNLHSEPICFPGCYIAGIVAKSWSVGITQNSFLLMLITGRYIGATTALYTLSAVMDRVLILERK